MSILNRLPVVAFRAQLLFLRRVPTDIFPVDLPSAVAMPVVLSGALDQYMAESLKEQLLASVSTAETELLLDMTAVEHVDACALQVLLAFKAGLKQDKLRINGADASIQQWIRIAGAGAFFEFSDLNS